MKEIRLQGRGGQGVVKAAQIVVKAAVAGNLYGQAIPFFGVERKGSPVFGFLRLDNKPIRRKMQVYTPDIIMIFDDSLTSATDVFAGLKENGMIIINSAKPMGELHIPKQVGSVAVVDAKGIAEAVIGKNLPNTAMLGAFAKATGLVNQKLLFTEINNTFGEKNQEAAIKAYNEVQIYQ